VEPSLTPAQLHEGMEIEVEVERRAWRVVASVKRCTDEDVTVEDHEWSVWTLPYDDIAMRPATPFKRRRYHASLLRQRLASAKAFAKKQVDDLEPMDAAGPDDFSTPGIEVVDTPVGPYMWPKRTAPNAAQRREWEKTIDQVEAWEQRLAQLVVDPHAIAPGKAIPEEADVDDLVKLASEGMFEASDLEVFQQWKAFWIDNPDARDGLVQDDGTILPEVLVR
jgi:hypothetical protein